MLHWLHQFYDPDGIQHLVSSGGLAVLCAIIFAETGLLVGFFLPGDSLLFLAGTLCTVNLLDPAQAPPLSYSSLALALIACAVLGNSLNYLFGRLAGQRAWSRSDGRIVTRKRLEQAHAFYEQHGVLSLVLTRFVPVARTFVPFVAGMSRMGFVRFSVWNLVGAAAWVLLLTAAGYHLGRIAFVQKHIEVIVLAVVLVSLLPIAIGMLARLRAPTGVDRGGALHAGAQPLDSPPAES
jgi:membrane-associated protein